jgi:hypothetical protein
MIKKLPTLISPIKTISHKFFLALIVAIVCIGALSYSVKQETPSVAATANKPVPATEVDNLKKQLDEAKRKLEETKKRQAEISNQINNESQNQGKLADEAVMLEKRLEQAEAEEQRIKDDINKLSIESELIGKEKGSVETELTTLQSDIKSRKAELDDALNLVLKMNVNSPTFLEQTANFQDSVINDEKQKYISRVIRDNLNSLKKLEVEAVAKRDEVQAKEKALADAQAEKKAQTDSLAAQQAGLAYQRQYKDDLIEQSRRNQENLNKGKEELNKNQAEINKQIAEIQNKLNRVIDNVSKAPPGGTYIAAGTVIGYQGRTGLSCNPIENGVQRTNNYCQEYAGLSSYYYYYDPIKYPTKGSHLHFVYQKKGQYVNPYDALTNPNNKEFVNKPMQGAVVTGGYVWNSSVFHPAIDMVAYHGAPVMAVKPGRIQYYCDSFTPSPAYGARITHEDGSMTQYWHLQKRADSPPCIKA